MNRPTMAVTMTVRIAEIQNGIPMDTAMYPMPMATTAMTMAMPQTWRR